MVTTNKQKKQQQKTVEEDEPMIWAECDELPHSRDEQWALEFQPFMGWEKRNT